MHGTLGNCVEERKTAFHVWVLEVRLKSSKRYGSKLQANERQLDQITIKESAKTEGMRVNPRIE